MVEEIAEVEAAEDDVVTSGMDADGRVADALAELRANRTESLHVEPSGRRPLACVGGDDAGRVTCERVEAMLDSRTEKAVTIRDEFPSPVAGDRRGPGPERHG